jgi:hypothetical protein
MSKYKGEMGKRGKVERAKGKKERMNGREIRQRRKNA